MAKDLLIKTPDRMSNEELIDMLFDAPTDFSDLLDDVRLKGD